MPAKIYFPFPENSFPIYPENSFQKCSIDFSLGYFRDFSRILLGILQGYSKELLLRLFQKMFTPNFFRYLVRFFFPAFLQNFAWVFPRGLFLGFLPGFLQIPTEIVPRIPLLSSTGILTLILHGFHLRFSPGNSSLISPGRNFSRYAFRHKFYLRISLLRSEFNDFFKNPRFRLGFLPVQT